MKITDLFNKRRESAPIHNRPLLQELVADTRNGFVDKIIPLLTTKEKASNPVSIPYTPEAVKADFEAVRQCMFSEKLSDDELAALIAVTMMKKHPKNISQLLSDNGYSQPTLERISYLGTYVSTIISLNEFASLGVKKYKISSCGDGKVCEQCAKQNGKKYLVSKAVIGKTAPPFCEKCRCVMIAEF
ncbi:MAG: minor capsid protein [Clostridiaceae bacterium]|nr:minor capsid protein [Clostridiaceae bacterium]